MEKIYSLDFGLDLIDWLADAILKEQSVGRTDFSSLAVVFPGKRPQFFLRKALAERIKGPFLPPRIYSIEEFIQYLAQKSARQSQNDQSALPIGMLDAAYLIYKAIGDLKLTYLAWQKELGFAQILLWARKIFQFLDELDKELVSAKQLLNLQANATIGLPVPDYLNHLLENINQIRTQFHALLKQYNLTTTGINYSRVAAAIDELRLEEFKRIYLAGFFALTASEKKIFKSLLEQGAATLLWQRDQDQWPIFEELEKFFAIKPQRIELKQRKSQKIRLYEGFDTHSQMQGVRDVLSAIRGSEDTCIVLPQAGALMPLLYQGLPASPDNYNISLGYPLKYTPLYALIDMIIRVHDRRRQDGSFYTRDYLNLIMHPYLKNISTPESPAEATRILIHKIEEVLLGIDKSAVNPIRAFIKLEQIEEDAYIFNAASGIIHNAGLTPVEAGVLRGLLRLIHQKFLFGFEDCLKLCDYVSAAQEMLNFILEKSKVQGDIFSGEAFERILGMLEEMGQVLFKDEPFKEKTAFFELFKSSLSYENIPFSGTPLKGLQILGLLETRCLKFNNLLVLDLNEGVLPKIDKGESLIPEGIFPVLGLNHYHKKEEIMRYHFRRLLSAAANAFLFYAVSSRNKEARSRFIEEIIWQEEKKNRCLFSPDKIKRIHFPLIPQRQEFSLKKSLAALEILNRQIYSASSLDMYLNCPARFYFHYCLGLREKEEIPQEQQAQDVGNLMHALLKDFYALFLNKTVTLDKESRDYLFELKEKKMQEFFAQESGERYLLSRIIDHKLKLFLNHEAKRKEEVKILYLEQEFPLGASEIKLQTALRQVSLKGKIDRIDERRFSGRRQLVILDYKTGGWGMPKKSIICQPPSGRQQIKKAIGSFQLPLYIYLFSQFRKVPAEQLQAGFYSLRDIEEQFLFGAGDSAGMLEACFKACAQILSEILCPDFEFVRDDSNSRYCSHCPFAALCKK